MAEGAKAEQKDLFTKRYRRIKGFEPEEQQIQAALVAYLQWRCRAGVIWFHIPNGGYRYKTTGAWLKALGVRAGVADLQFIWRADDVTHVLFLELKSRRGRQSVEQQEFQTECGVVGVNYELADSIDDAVAILKGYGILL